MFNLDDEVLKSVLNRLHQDDLNKALEGMHHETLLKAVKGSGLVYVQRQVSRKGKTFQQGMWVKASEADKHQRAGGEMKQTHEMHKDTGDKYNSGRAALHQKIVNKIVAECGKPEKGQKPVAILMGGGSASGKSTMRSKVIEKDLAESGIKAGTIDSDEIKNEIPEFASLKKTHPEDAARLVHEESSDIGSHALDSVIDQGRHFIYDGTMKNKKKYSDLVDRLKKAGYEVHAYVADVPLEEAIKRSDARAERSGRKVPHDIIESSHTGVPGTIEHIKDRLDSHRVYDNTDKLHLISSDAGVHDEEKYGKFLDKGKIKHNLGKKK